MMQSKETANTMTTLSESSVSENQIVVSLESFAQAGIIFVMSLSIIITNAIIVATYITIRRCRKQSCDGVQLFQVPIKGSTEVINCYLLSLAVADLLCGLVVAPFSVYSAIIRNWVYGDITCRLVGYVEVTLWAVTVYTFMWISVDRYLAARKPLRYETIQTKTRCQCWMAFTWISSAMLCCPPLLGFIQPIFDKQAYICMLDWGSMWAYSITLSILILGPSLITIVYSYTYIFHMKRKLESGYPFHDKEYATALAENLSNPSHNMSFALVIAFWCSWLPYITVHLCEYFGMQFQTKFLHFGIVWLGFMNSFWKSIILITLSPQFRLALRFFCMTLCCKYKGNIRGELIGMDDD